MKTQKSPPALQPEPKLAPTYQPPDHLKDDIVWELAKLFTIAGLPTLFLFYIFEIFLPFGAQLGVYEAKCEDRGGFVAEVQNQGKMCIRKDAIIKIE